VVRYCLDPSLLHGFHSLDCVVLYIWFFTWCDGYLNCFFYCFCKLIGRHPPCCFTLCISWGVGFAQVCIYISKIDVVRLSISLIVCDHSSWVSFCFCFEVCIICEIEYNFLAKNLVINL
jgi:hypothetical protein